MNDRIIKKYRVQTLHFHTQFPSFKKVLSVRDIEKKNSVAESDLITNYKWHLFQLVVNSNLH